MYLRRNFIFAMTLLLGICLPISQHGASAQIIELGPDEAIRLALENNLTLKKSLIDLAASGYSEKRLWAEIFPTISASASTGFQSPLFSGDGFELNDNTKINSIGLGLNLGFSAGTYYSIKSIQLAHQSNLLRYEEASKQLSIQVTKYFYSLAAEKNNLDYLKVIFSLSERQYERNQVSFRNGLIGERALMQSRLSVENARYNLSAAGISYANNLGEFLSTLGMAQNADVSLLGDIKITKIDADAEYLIREYLPKRPDIVRSNQEIERLIYAERQTYMQGRSPSLNLSMNWENRKFDPHIDTLSGTARLTIPVDSWIPGTPRSQTFMKANDSIKKARMDLTIAQDAAKNQIRSLSVLLRNSWDSIQIARLSLEVAQRSYQLTDEGFRNGIVESLELEEVRNNMASARQRLLQSELSYFNMILELSAALNIEWKKIIELYGVPGEKE